MEWKQCVFQTQQDPGCGGVWSLQVGKTLLPITDGMTYMAQISPTLHHPTRFCRLTW